MNDLLETALKNEIDEIAGRIAAIMKKIDALSPETKEEKPQEEQLPKDQVEITEEVIPEKPS
ncbi:MAG: hypothetical protein JSW04_08570 [Desulfobacterales bacterium]|nr:MAG: hypothetical protein JSW04_08570 [Desulfobacterales bacterium]